MQGASCHSRCLEPHNLLSSHKHHATVELRTNATASVMGPVVVQTLPSKEHVVAHLSRSL